MNKHKELVTELQVDLKNKGYTQKKICELIFLSKNTLKGYFRRKDMPLSVYCHLKELSSKNSQSFA